MNAVRDARSFQPMRLMRRAELQFDRFELIESIPGASGPTYRPLLKDMP